MWTSRKSPRGVRTNKDPLLMSTARYLFRVDDACHTMARGNWQAIEDIFDDTGIKPIVAVIPENGEPQLHYEDADPGFWNRVRSWQAKGWTIAMHGYRHVMHATKSKLILPFYEHSEFGGLPHDVQAEKIRRSWRIFLAEGVEPTVWVAPAHSFDRITLAAIREETTIRIVSDGIARDQFFDEGFFWIPQQLWSLTEKRDGLWTVCLHPNTMSGEQARLLRASIAGGFQERAVSLDDVKLEVRPKSLVDQVYDFCFWQRHRVNHAVEKAKAAMRG